VLDTTRGTPEVPSTYRNFFTPLHSHP
jgi:hypothetical protein